MTIFEMLFVAAFLLSSLLMAACVLSLEFYLVRYRNKRFEMFTFLVMMVCFVPVAGSFLFFINALTDLRNSLDFSVTDWITDLMRRRRK